MEPGQELADSIQSEGQGKCHIPMNNGITVHFRLVSGHYGLSPALGLACIYWWALGLAVFSSISYIHLNYIRYYLYTHLYDMDTFSSLILTWLPLPTLMIYFYYPVYHLQEILRIIYPPRALPMSCQWHSVIGSPFWDLG